MNTAAMLLLADPSPALRHRVLTELLDVPPSDPEAADLAARRSHLPELDALGRSGAGGLREMSWTLCRLAFLGFGRELPLVRVIAERLLAHQADDGSFPLEEVRGGTGESRYSMIPLQVSLPLRGLAATGYAKDPRAERAYQWLLDQRLDDGAWPLGVAAGQPGYIAGYRRLPGSKGCRVNTEAAIACLVLHPDRRRSDETRRALDLLLQRETREEWSLGSEVTRLAATDEVPGFVTSYARFDLAFVLELASRAGASTDDPRIRDLVAFLLAGRGREGLWDHPERPQLGRWLTLELLLSLRRLETGDWAGAAPRVPFRALRRPRR